MMAEVRYVQDNTQQILAAIHAAVSGAVAETSVSARDRIVRKIMNPPKSGRIYISRAKPSPHQASAPGESPANWTGRLAAATFETHRGAEGEAGIDLAKAPHGQWLEHGTPSGKLAPRPVVMPTAIEEEPLFLERMQSAVRKAVD